MEALRVDGSSNAFQQHANELRAAARNAAKQHLLTSHCSPAETLEACGLPVLAERCGQHVAQHPLAVDMVLLLREALGMICQQVQEAQRYNDLLERKCWLYNTQIQHAGGGVKSGHGGGEHLSAPMIEPAMASSPQGPGRPSEALSPPSGPSRSRCQTDQTDTTEADSSGSSPMAAPMNGNMTVLVNGSAVVPHERGPSRASSGNNAQQAQQEKLQGQHASANHGPPPNLAASENKLMPPPAPTTGRGNEGTTKSKLPRESDQTDRSSMASMAGKRGVSFQLPSDSSEDFESASSSSPSEALSEMYEPLSQSEVTKMRSEFDRIRHAMGHDEEREYQESGTEEAVTGSAEPPKSSSAHLELPGGLGEDHDLRNSCSLLAGRQSRASQGQLEAAMRGDFGEVRATGHSPRKSDFFAKRRTAIALDRNNTPDLSGLMPKSSAEEDEEEDVPEFFAGRRTAVSIASSSGGRYSCLGLDKKPPEPPRPAPSKVPDAKGAAKTPPKTKFAGLAEGGAMPTRRLTLFKGGKKS